MDAYHDIVSKRRKGAAAVVARLGLHTLAVPYRGLLAGRNCLFDLEFGVTWLDRPCISVGNMTTGGTGKTPLVIWLASHLIGAGHRVGILSRGYGGENGANDELKLVSENCPQAICVANADRVLAGKYAIAEHGVDALLLDDGFQHRRLGRDLDIVLIDATCPFGYGHILPRGLLREPLGGLARAQILIITHSAQVPAAELAAIKARCSEIAPGTTLLACNHRAVGWVGHAGEFRDADELVGRGPLAFAGLGNPETFAATLADMGAKPVKFMRFPDHHRYQPSDCQDICQWAERVGADLLVTTEKDLVKLRDLSFDWPVPLWALKIKIDFVGEGGNILLQCVDDLFTEEPNHNGPSAIPAD